MRTWRADSTQTPSLARSRGLTVLDVAEALKVSRNTVYVLLYSGELESVKIGKCRRISRSALRTFVERLSAAGGIV